MLDELKEIEEIISRLDAIPLEEWSKKNNETEEEFEKSLETIEEDIEEDLIDAISDSLLDQQSIDEAEAIKEAREKIEKEYEIYQEAFEKDSNGKITLKSKEELEKLNYTSDEEIEKLDEIASNYNNPDGYIEAIKNSINAQKDIDAEIERKLEIAKIYISAKLRGEEPVIPIDEAKTKKYEENNKYVQETKQLKRVPLVQNEMIYNNRIISQNYVPYVPSTQDAQTIQVQNTNAVQANNNMATVVTTPRTTVKNPAKIKVLKNVETKMEKTNDLTKQKIKARTEIKALLKPNEGKTLTEQEANELKQKIAEIEKKYPNTITAQTLSKLYDNFRVKLPDANQNLQNINSTKSKTTNTNSTPIKNITSDDDVKKLNGTIQKIFIPGQSGKVDMANININDLLCLVGYLKKNNNPKMQVALDKIIKNIEDFTTNNFTTNLDNLNGYFDIRILEYMCQYCREGIKSNDGTRFIIKKDRDKALQYLTKELDYLNHIKARVDNRSDNPIENLKNEATFNQLIHRFRNARLTVEKCIDGIDLMMMTERIKRNNNGQLDGYKATIENEYEKIKNNNKMGRYALETLGDIFYKGVQATDGDIIIPSDITRAKAIYEKLLIDYPDYENKVAYKSLYNIYNDNRQPFYDKDKAEKIKQIMQQEGIALQPNVTKSSKRQPCVYVCSDIHGEYEAYKTVIDRLGQDDKLYILGDVVDRGNDGIKILQDVMKRQEKGQVEFLMGNHELLMIQTLLGNKRINYEDTWLKGNGAEDTTYKDFKNLPKQEQEKIVEFLENTPIYKQIEAGNQDYYLVHAKAIQDTDKPSQTFKEMMESGQENKILETLQDRAPDDCRKSDIAKKGIFTIIGHTPTYRKVIEPGPGYIDIDCGISYGKQLALINLTEGKVEYYNAEKIREKAKSRTKQVAVK